MVNVGPPPIPAIVNDADFSLDELRPTVSFAEASDTPGGITQYPPSSTTCLFSSSTVWRSPVKNHLMPPHTPATDSTVSCEAASWARLSSVTASVPATPGVSRKSSRAPSYGGTGDGSPVPGSTGPGTTVTSARSPMRDLLSGGYQGVIAQSRAAEMLSLPAPHPLAGPSAVS